MSFPEHLHLALGQVEEHLLQSWEISQTELRLHNEALQQEIAQQYAEILELREKIPAADFRPPELEREIQDLRALNLEMQERHKQLLAEMAELKAPKRNEKAEELEQELKGLQALYQDSQERRAALDEQLAQVREQLDQEAAQSARLTLEMVDLKLEQQKERLRLRGIPSGPQFNLPDLVAEEKQPDQNEQLQRLAYQDPETGLPNLNLALRYLQIELDKKEKNTVALVILQVEQWAELESMLTDPQERQLLASQFVERVRSCLRPEDVVARGPAGEFWLIFPWPSGGPLGVKSLSELAQRSLAKLVESLKTPLAIEDHKLLFGFWAGLTVSQGEDDLAGLQQQARLAQQAAQSKGSARFALFVKEMEKPGRLRLEQIPHLRQALAREQFSLRFQPVVELKTGVIKGVEALVRWEHPTRGTIEPGEFLEAACHSGVIVGLGQWVMACVCELSSDYRSLYWFINLSRPELMQADLVRRLTKSMESAQLSRPDFIVLECKESDLARRDPRISANLAEMKKWKVGLGVDDYAFSDLPLKDLDKRGVRFLKLSSQMTRNLDQAPVRELVKGGLLAAEAAGARVLLKGLENQGMLDLALETGCAWGQGYRLCPPLTWPEMQIRLASRS